MKTTKLTEANRMPAMIVALAVINGGAFNPIAFDQRLPGWVWFLNRGTGQPVRHSERYHVGVQEEPMPLAEKAATAFMTVAIAGIGPACVALLLLL